MYDFTKLRVRDYGQIQAILQLPFLDFTLTFSKSSAIIQEYPQSAKWKDWKFTVYSPDLLEIQGSLHKYFTGSTNASDFPLSSVKSSIINLSQRLHLDPEKAFVTNLEFGVNLEPIFTPKEILSQVICYKNTLPIHPYQNRDKGFLLDFKSAESYIKLYDKGAQLGKGTLLRSEVKGMTSRYFTSLDISTLYDLTKQRTANTLERRLKQVFSHVVFSDDSIEESSLSHKELLLYLKMKDPKEWVNCKGEKTVAFRRRENRFKALLAIHGKRDLHSYLPAQIALKWQELASA